MQIEATATSIQTAGSKEGRKAKRGAKRAKMALLGQTKSIASPSLATPEVSMDFNPSLDIITQPTRNTVTAQDAPEDDEVSGILGDFSVVLSFLREEKVKLLKLAERRAERPAGAEEEVREKNCAVEEGEDTRDTLGDRDREKRRKTRGGREGGGGRNEVQTSVPVFVPGARPIPTNDANGRPISQDPGNLGFQNAASHSTSTPTSPPTLPKFIGSKWHRPSDADLATPDLSSSYEYPLPAPPSPPTSHHLKPASASANRRSKGRKSHQQETEKEKTREGPQITILQRPTQVPSATNIPIPRQIPQQSSHPDSEDDLSGDAEVKQDPYSAAPLGLPTRGFFPEYGSTWALPPAADPTFIPQERARRSSWEEEIEELLFDDLEDAVGQPQVLSSLLANGGLPIQRHVPQSVPSIINALPLPSLEKARSLERKLERHFSKDLLPFSDVKHVHTIPHSRRAVSAPLASTPPSNSRLHAFDSQERPTVHSKYGFWPSPPVTQRRDSEAFGVGVHDNALRPSPLAFLSAKAESLENKDADSMKSPNDSSNTASGYTTKTTVAEKVCFVFIDNSNILCSLLQGLQASHPDIFLHQSSSVSANANASSIVPTASPSLSRLRAGRYRPRLDYHSLFRILERGRNVERRVVVASSPLHQGLEEARDWGYEINLMERVPKKEAVPTSTSSPPRHSRFHSRQDPSTSDIQTDSANEAEFEAEAGTTETESDNRGSTSPRKMVRFNKLASGSRGRTVVGQLRIGLKEQGVDELLHLKITESLLDHDPGPDIQPVLVLATGDAKASEFNPRGFYGCVERALKRGWEVEIVAWERAVSWSWEELVRKVEWRDKVRIVLLDDFLEELVS